MISIFIIYLRIYIMFAKLGTICAICETPLYRASHYQIFTFRLTLLFVPNLEQNYILLKKRQSKKEYLVVRHAVYISGKGKSPCPKYHFRPITLGLNQMARNTTASLYQHDVVLSVTLI